VAVARSGSAFSADYGIEYYGIHSFAIEHIAMIALCFALSRSIPLGQVEHSASMLLIATTDQG
jgi:hypothetical protein